MLNSNTNKTHNHQLPEPNPSYCSCCRKGIISGSQNVVRVDKAPERIYKPTGELWGVEGKKEPKAYYHATCFQNNHYKAAGRIECEKCGVLSMVKTLPNGKNITEFCFCSCHSGKDYCSVLLA